MRIKDRFTGVGNRLSDEERAQIREMETRYGKRHVEWPFPRSQQPPSKIEQRFPNNGRQLFESEKPIVEEFNEKYADLLSPELKERKAVLKYLGNKVPWEILMDIQEGRHLEL